MTPWWTARPWKLARCGCDVLIIAASLAQRKTEDGSAKRPSARRWLARLQAILCDGHRGENEPRGPATDHGPRVQLDDTALHRRGPETTGTGSAGDYGRALCRRGIRRLGLQPSGDLAVTLLKQLYHARTHTHNHRP